jgi:LPS sulfotransferase NodH
MRYTEAQITSELLDQPPFFETPRKIFICSTPRSGSYMLCRYMINAGLGVPHEYFNPVIMRDIAPRLSLEEDIKNLKWRPRGLRDHLPFGKMERSAEINFLSKYLKALIWRRCQHGIFAAKIHFDQYTKILDNPVGRDFLENGFFIHIFREDLLKQAVSRNFAYITGRWGIDDTVTTVPMPQSDLLDPKGVDRELQTLADEDREWRLFLARNGVGPLTISYEQFCKEPVRLVSKIAECVGIDPKTLRQGYNEPVTSASETDPTLPNRTEVIDRYLSAMRQIQPAVNRGLGRPSARSERVAN